MAFFATGRLSRSLYSLNRGCPNSEKVRSGCGQSSDRKLLNKTRIAYATAQCNKSQRLSKFIVTFKVAGGVAYSSSQTCLTDAGTHVPYGITLQRWHFRLYPSQFRQVTRFSDPGGMQGWVDLAKAYTSLLNIATHFRHVAVHYTWWNIWHAF